MGWREWLGIGTREVGSTYADSVRGPDLSISDPALAAWLGRTTAAGAPLDPLSIPAYWRTKSLIVGTIAGLPLKSYRKLRDGTVERIPTFLDDPGGPYANGGLTPFKWKEIVASHLFDEGDAFLEHITNNAGALVGLLPRHPSRVTKVEWNDDATKTIEIQGKTAPKEYVTGKTMTQIIGFGDSTLRGERFLDHMAGVIRTSVEGNAAAAKSFRGAGKVLLSTMEDVSGDDAKIIKTGLDRELADENSRLAFVNRQLKLDDFEKSAKDAQFIESRAFQVEEWARAGGAPTNLLSVSGAISNWGTGQAEANLGLQKYTLASYTIRMQDALSRLLPKAAWCEFEFKGLLMGTPAEEIRLVIEQLAAGLMDVETGARILNLPKPKKPRPLPAPTPIKEAV